jgi:hypothetical protein
MVIQNRIKKYFLIFKGKQKHHMYNISTLCFDYQKLPLLKFIYSIKYRDLCILESGSKMTPFMSAMYRKVLFTAAHSLVALYIVYTSRAYANN